MAKVRAEWTDAPSAEAIEAREIDLMFNADTWAETVTGAERETVDRLTETFSAEQLAAAFLRLYRDKRPAPEDLSDPQAKPAPRPEFGASVWFSISGGREAGAEPRRVLPMVLKATGLGKDDIGAIRVRQDETFVQVAEAKAGALPPMGENRELEPGAVMRRLAEAPQLGGGADRAMPERKNKAQGRYRSEGPKEVSPVPRKRKPAASGKEGSKPVRTGKPRAADVSGDPTVKPRKPGKPKGPKPPIGKPNSKKNKARAAAAAKKPRAKSGHRGKQGGPKN
jgi:ATP-dependent RNA helicase DeaD